MKLAIAVFVAVTALLTPPPATAACNTVDGGSYGHCENFILNIGSGSYIEAWDVESVSGRIAGATVHNGGTLNFSGVSNGDLIVMAGGRLVVSGKVRGRIINEGGHVVISGVVDELVMRGGDARISGVVHYVSGHGRINGQSIR